MSTGTHRRRCREETCKETNILITAAVSQLSTVSGSVMSPTQVHSHCFRSVHTSSQVICLLFFCPPPTLPKTCTTVRTTPLYGKWSGNKHRILVIPPLWFSAPLVPFPILTSVVFTHDAWHSCLWNLLAKTGCSKLLQVFPHRCDGESR